MKLREQVSILVFKTFFKDVCKKMVITIPMPLIVQRDDEEVHVFEGFQHHLPIDSARAIRLDDSLAQRAAKAIQDRGLQQEGTHVFRLQLKHFFNQVVHDIVMTARKGRNKTMNVLAALHRKGCQL